MEENGPSGLPTDVWSLILTHFHHYDIIFVRATGMTMYKLCKRYRPFSKYFVLDQEDCLAYLVQHGYLSCTSYVKNILRFGGWTKRLCKVAASSGRVDTLEYLLNNGLTFNKERILLECTAGACNLDMIKYLRDHGAFWSTASTSSEMDNMAQHGHLECMIYALENGCTGKTISYTPSIQCLDFAIQNGFDWSKVALNAAKQGNLPVLRHAHESGANLAACAAAAAREGHIHCLRYVTNHMTNPVPASDVPSAAKTLPCFKHVLEHFGISSAQTIWLNQLSVGNVEILRLLLQHAPVPRGHPLVRKAMLSLSTKSVELFKFMLDEAKEFFDEVDPYFCCARCGNLEGLKLAFERNLPMNGAQGTSAPHAQLFLYEAVSSQNLDVLKYVWEKTLNKEGIIMAGLQLPVTRSTPEILDFLTQHGAQWSSGHLTRTARLGNLPNLAYLARIGCQWSDNVLRSSSAQCIKYAQEHGCKNALFEKL